MKVVDIYLHAIEVRENGRKGAGEALNLIEFTLHYPREGVSALSTVKQVKLKDNKTHRPAKRFVDQIVFREALRGKCQLNVKVLSVDKPGVVERALRLLVKNALGGLLASAGSAVSSVFTAKDLENAGASLGDLLEQNEACLAVIGEAELLLDPDNLPAEVSLPLEVKIAA